MSTRKRRNLVPGIAAARAYRAAWLWPDIRAGLILSSLLVPAGMGFAQAAGLPAYSGLYATIIPILAYAVFGPSRILVVGPDSALAPLIAAAILPLAAGNDERAVQLAGLLAVMVGVVLITAGVLRLGLVADLISKPIRHGYLNGIALILLISQLPQLLGITIATEHPMVDLANVATAVWSGETRLLSLAFGLSALTVIVFCRWLWRDRIPGMLVAVAASILASWTFRLEDMLPMVGALPQGLPALGFGSLELHDVTALILPALGIALIATASTSVVSRTLSSRHGETVSGNTEMRGLGAANLTTGLLGGFPVSGSATRTPVVIGSGGRTQFASVVGAFVVLVLVLVAPQITAYLPSSVLAVVVIVAVSALVRPVGRASWRADRWDTVLTVAAFLGVIIAGVLPGILVAVGLSFIAFVWQAWHPYRAELGRIPGVRGYHDRARNHEAERVPGIIIVRWDAPLFFANASLFDQWVRSVVRRAGETETGQRGPIHTVIVAAEPITDIDSTAMDELVHLDDYLHGSGIRLLLAELKGPVRDRIRRHRLTHRFGEDRFPPTVGAAVDSVTGEIRGDLPADPTSDEGPADPSR